MTLYIVMELDEGSAFNIIKLFNDESEAVDFAENEHNASIEIYEITGDPIYYEYTRGV